MKRLAGCFYRAATAAALALVFLPSLYEYTIGASIKPDERRIAVVADIIDLVYSDSFMAAYRMAETINDTLPGKPIYNLVTASILHAEMTDLEDFSESKRFFTLLDSSKKYFERWIDGNPEDPWGYYFLGTVHAYKSMLHAQRDSWLKSFIEGLKAKGRFTGALAIDPGLYDAYAGLGNYHFWSSAILRKYIPFLDDNRDEGLKELRLAVDSSYFSSKPAATGLAWALINLGRYKEATDIGMNLYRETSGGRISLWIMGGISWKWGRLNDAVTYYGKLIKSLNQLGEQNDYNLIFCRYRRGVCQFLMRRYGVAKDDFDIILSYDPPKEIRKRHKKTYEKTREYLDKIEAQLNKKR